MRNAVRGAEWPTYLMLVLCYGLWGLGTTALMAVSEILAFAAVTVGATLHSSLTHEALHGHPTRRPVWNAALVYPALSIVVPYLRFKDTHLAHHRDAVLTDPYDDPESNYLDPAAWSRLSHGRRHVLQLNNTLAGRMVLGPVLGTAAFVASDLRLVWAGDRRVLLGWLLHIPALALVLGWVAWVAVMPVWLWLLATYAALAILKVRTFLEHQAHEIARGRTVIVEDRGPLALLFLNNNLHVVHHMHASVPWYRLPRLYRANRMRYLTRNEGYRYRSYAEVFARFLFRAKDPVPHPLWRR